MIELPCLIHSQPTKLVMPSFLRWAINRVCGLISLGTSNLYPQSFELKKPLHTQLLAISCILGVIHQPLDL